MANTNKELQDECNNLNKSYNATSLYKNIMNYGGVGSINGVGINSDDGAASISANNDDAAAAAAWETILAGNYFGGGDFLNSPAASSSPPTMANTTTTTTMAMAYDPSVSQGYANACHLAAVARFPRHHGNNNNGGTSNATTNTLFHGYHTPKPPPQHHNGYAMFMPGGNGGGASQPQPHLFVGEGSGSGGRIFHHNPQFDLRLPSTTIQQQQQQYTDYGNYYDAAQNVALAASAAMSPSPNRMVDRIVTDDGNGRSFSGTIQHSGTHHHHHHQHQQQQQHCGNNINSNGKHYDTGSKSVTTAGASPDDINLNELEYCDALLRGIDDSNNSNLSWLENVFTHEFGDLQGNKRKMMSQQQQQQQQPITWGEQGDWGGEQNKTALDDYLVAQIRQQHKHHQHVAEQMQLKQQMQHQQHYNNKETTRPHTSFSTIELGSSRGMLPRSTKSSSAAAAAVATATTSSSWLSPNCADHSSLPSAQIDPLLERISLTVTAVSLTPMSGNEVVRHIRNKTDDVITRFLPCVDFLVNCQQELRQGLALAQQQQQKQQRGRRGAQSRNNAIVTPRQFHASYVAPLPNRFKRQNEPLMAREHLHHALSSLESLVRDAAAAVPQGHDHVKNAFLGGMRENQSWGLRKWLSEHGGAGSICNDVEEVMRHIKALKKEEETTKRLAEMLRPIARQAHDRLKKDVPASYQEKSTAHPYLPFFHRLESCLKQMASYDPEEDDVICLEDSDDEDVTVLSDKAVMRQSPVATTSRSPSTSLPSTMKEDTAFSSKWAEGFVEGRMGNETKRLKLDSGGQSSTAGPLIGEQYEDGEKDKMKEPEVICLVDSDDEEDEKSTFGHTIAFGFDLGRLDSLSPRPLVRKMATDVPQKGSISQHGTFAQAGEWRCVQCTFLNEAFSKQCAMCNDDDSADGGNNTDDLANFLGGGSFLLDGPGNHSINGSDNCLQLNCLSPTNNFTTDSEQHQWRALQSADARELECLAKHISGKGSLPNQAHLQTDKFWAMSDTFPKVLMLFSSILQHPTSYRFLEPVNETQLLMAGSPEYTSIIKHPLCFHEIVSALSRSEDAVVHPFLSMRLSNGKLSVANNGELEHWNMWNGLHLIEAIDLVLLNSLAYNGSFENSQQQQIETESLRDLLWEGVNSLLKRLQPHRRREHLPQRRSVDSCFVVVKADRR